MKPVRLSLHAEEQLTYRGASLEEVEEAIRSEEWTRAERGRLECRRDIQFRREWNGTRYATKQVRPIFVDEDDEIVVVTVYVYYF